MAFLLFCLFIIINCCLSNCMIWELSVKKDYLKNVISFANFPRRFFNIFLFICYLLIFMFLFCNIYFSLQTARSNSWHARYTILTYLQTMVFYNLFIFLNNEEAVNDIRWLVIKLLEDEQLEVSHIAAQLFSFT